MERGELVWVDLDPARSNEANQRRPAVVVSNDGANRSASRLECGVITVVPVSSNVDRVYPFQVFLPAKRCSLDRDSKAQAEQIRCVSVSRVGDSIGRLPADLIGQLDAALLLHLGL